MVITLCKLGYQRLNGKVKRVFIDETVVRMNLLPKTYI